jgi:Flp pilus assembly protein TadG
MAWEHRGSRDARGAVAVEFALVLPLLLMLLLGTVTAGLSYSQSIGVTNAVREGARFGASADDTASWPADVLSRVRATQFDDSGTPPETAVCVQLYKQGTGPVSGMSDCEQGDGSVSPALAISSNPATPPKVPSGVPTDTCVVRVLAARNFTINAILASWDQTAVRGSVARYEGEC